MQKLLSFFVMLAMGIMPLSISAQVTPSVTLMVNGESGPISSHPNSTLTLSWTSSDTTSCMAGGFRNWEGGKPTSGSQSVNPSDDNAITLQATGRPAGGIEYGITCTNDQTGLSASDFVFVRFETGSNIPSNTQDSSLSTEAKRQQQILELQQLLATLIQQLIQLLEQQSQGR